LRAQWSLTGPAGIGAAAAWRLTVGGAVTVALIDSGLDLEHPDFRGQLWSNPAELAGNQRDDDGNGLVDDIHGYDFTGRRGSPIDEHGHGTAVAGVVGACADNGFGTTGVAWRVRLMALKTLDACQAPPKNVA
jgi:subtilisin family serine protease